VNAAPAVDAVIFDLDGVLIDSESVWERVRERYVCEAGGTYTPEATRAIMGMSAAEWSHYIRTRLGVERPEARINADVVAAVAAAYRAHLPLLPGAREAVRRIGANVPVAIASSSNRELIDLFVELADLAEAFAVTVSADDVAHGKPAPDVYLRAAALLGTPPERCGAVEDSSNGIRSAHAAGTFVVAIPTRDFPAAPDALALARRVLPDLAALSLASFT